VPSQKNVITTYHHTEELRFELDHNWLKFPDGNKIPSKADVQGLSEDPDSGDLYLTFASNEIKGHELGLPAVLVFDVNGNFIRQFAPEAHGGGHGIRFIKLHEEKFVFVTCVRTCKVYKYNAETGELLLTISKPDFYGVREFKPTNTAPFSDGRFAVTDGYRSNFILLYSKEGELLTWFDASSNLKIAAFDQPHGISTFNDDSLIITDRKNERLVRVTVSGEYIDSFELSERRHPCNVNIYGKGQDTQYLVPELWHSIGIYDSAFNLIKRIGDGENLHRVGNVCSNKSYSMRRALENSLLQDSEIAPDSFLYPHDAIWTNKHSGKKGNILVGEWNYFRRGSGVTLIRFR